jgi:AcrR family transcriptional regulator
MAAEPGLRERKKEQTRRAIAEAARRLFAERGFDAVTVADVARAADVSVGTAFNYFPTKEDLFYGQMEAFEAALVNAVNERPPGESVLEAFRRFVLSESKQLAAEERAETVATAARIINGSAALRAREREIVAQYKDELAALIAKETSGPAENVESRAVASALMGVQRALVHYVRASVLSGVSGPKLAADVRSQAKRAFGRLERGLADYAVKKP